MTWRFSKLSNLLFPICAISLYAFGMLPESQISTLTFICILAVISIALGFLIKKAKLHINTNSSLFLYSGILALFVLPFFQLSTPYSIYIETRIYILAIILLALSITLGLAGMVDLGIGAYIGIGAYVSTRLSMDMGLSVLLTPFLGACAAAIIAKFLSSIILKARGHYFALATLGLGLVAYHVFIQATPLTFGTDGIGNIPSISIFGISPVTSINTGNLMLPGQIISYYWTLILFILIFMFVNRFGSGQFGRCLQAIRTNEIAAISSGVNVTYHLSWAYTIAGGIAGFAGALHAHTLNYIAPGDFGLQASVFFLALTVLAGLGKPVACVITAFGIIFLEEKLRGLGDLRMLILAIAILVIIIYRTKVFNKEPIFAGSN